MTLWLIAGSILYLLTCYASALFMINRLGLRGFLGSRDAEAITHPVHARTEKAARNFRENYPVFMGLGILSLVVPGADMTVATWGAAVFVLARVVYLPFYMMAVQTWRSMVFMVGWCGMVAMGYALL